MKKIFLLVIIFITILIPFSCEDSVFIVDCDKCFKTKPDEINLEIRLTIDDLNRNVPITVYRGKVDNGDVILEDTTYLETYYTPKVAAGEYYSAVARYVNSGRVIYVIDGRELKVKSDKSSCDDQCYTIHGKVLDLRLR